MSAKRTRVAATATKAVVRASTLLSTPAERRPGHARIVALIEAHLDESLPAAWRGVKAEGHDVAALDAHSVACMLVFVQGPERFGWKGCWLLQECHLALCEVVESPRVLAAGGAGAYLERARAITGMILEDRCAALARRRRRRRWWQAA